MSSTNFVIGADGVSKNTSRVLRPPGGGHTDILGLREPTNTVPRKEDNRRNASSILEGTNHTPAPVVEKPAAETIKTIEEPKKTDEKPVMNDQGSQKVRVPPGGFSSGFW